MSANFRHHLPYLLLSVAVFLADQLSKSWAGRFLAERGATVVNNQLTLIAAHNRGVGFGLLQGSASLVGWLTLGVALALLIWLWRTPASQRWLLVGLSLTLGGALGNMVDRILAGQVLDFLQTPWWPRVFNLADVAIRLGVVLILVGMLLQRPVEHPQVKSERV